MDRYQEHEYRQWVKKLEIDLIRVEIRNLKFVEQEDYFSPKVKTIAKEKLEIIQYERGTNL